MKQLSILLVCLMVPSLRAVTVSDIEGLRVRAESNQSELSSADRDLIETFWDDTLNRMLLTEQPQDTVEFRRQLESQKGSQPLSQYAAAYLASARQNLPAAFENARRIEDVSKQVILEQNLMILAAQLQSPALAEIALEELDNADSVIRYWAVKAVTNSGVIQSLRSDVTANQQDIQVKILEALEQRLEREQQIEILTMIIDFSASIDHPKAREILFSIADKRIEAYINWSLVDRETLDIPLLVGMGNAVTATKDAQVKSTVARKFAELYSLVFQRYLTGQAVLSEKQLEQVINVILEVDKEVLAKMLNVPQTRIFSAIQRKVGLDGVYESIFGNRLISGDLSKLYKFDYGKDASGNPINEPPKLPAPPTNP